MYSAYHREHKEDLAYRERRDGETLGEENIFLGTPAGEAQARFSPDDRYVAYASDETGRPEVYIRDFPGGQKRLQVSTNGGSSPRWRRDGRELFFADGARLMAASVAPGSSLKVGTPALLFEKRSVGFLQFDAAANGKRFIILERPAPERPLSVHVVQNWFEEFRTPRLSSEPHP